MPTYTTVITQVDDSTINFAIPSVTPSVTNIVPVDSFFTNMITSVIENMGGAFMTSPLPNSYNLTSTVAGMGSVFGDSVYRCQGSFEAGLDTYSCDDYFLVTTAIDAAILALPYTTGVQIAQKDYMISLRAQVDTFFNAANYSDANTYIEYIEVLLVVIPTGADPIDSSVSLTTASTATAIIDPYIPGPTGEIEGAWYNTLTNTLTGTVLPYTWNWDIEAGGSNVINNITIFSDGVYLNFVSNLWAGTFPPKTGFEFEGISYMLVTTTITAGITSWQVAYDQLVNPTQTQIDDNTFLDGALAAIQAAFDAELYTQANALITQVQAILSGGIGIAMYLNLATTGTKAYKEQNMLNYFLSGSLPSGTYSNQDSTLTNTITNEAWSFPSTYPANSTDYTEILNSNDLATVSKWTDAVYRSNVEFNIGSTFYQCLGYCLVLTSMNCVITKITQSADSCKSLQKQLGKLVSLRQMAIDSFNAGNFTGANSAINKFNNVTSTCNCGCR